jgi:ATP-binding cassette subfamily B protein
MARPAPALPTTPETPSHPLITEADRPMWRLFRYTRPHRGLFMFGIGSSVGNKVLDLMPPLLVGWVIDTVRRDPPAWIAGVVGSEDAWGQAAFLAVLAVVIFAFESLFQWMYQLGFMTLAQRVQHDLRCDAYNKIQNRELEFFEEHRTGETMAMLNDDVNQLERFLNVGFNDLVQLVTLFIFAIVVLTSTSWQLALIGLVPIPLIIIGSVFYQKLISPRYRKVRETVGRLSSRLENNLAGNLVIKSFTAEKFEADRVRAASSEYRDANFRAIKFAALYVPIIRMGVALGFGGVLLIGSHWVLTDAGVLTVGQLVLFSMLIQRVLWPLTRLGTTLDEFERAKAGARRTFGLLNTPAVLQDPAEPKSYSSAITTDEPLGAPDTGHESLRVIAGRVTFDDVRFAYRRGTPVLAGLTFEAAPGEMIGIAGPTGAGKSTLVKLLLRLYDVTGGAVRIDGIDVRDVRMADLRRQIALVSQDVYLFHGTIRENIAYGMDGASDEAVARASELAHLHNFVMSLPQTYNTIVGERGIKLSGGQRQRLSIARAILKDAPILVLDEATSSVDTETEREIQQNLGRLAQGRTALVIAHRLSTIRHADRIVVLRDGRVAEEGRHDELIARGGTYSDLWHVQSGDLPTRAQS